MPLSLPTCCVKKCVRRDGDRNASVLHKWPSDGGVANIWKTNIKSVQTDFDLSKLNLDELFVCSDHFSDDCFKVTEDEELTDDLLPDAAPTIFPKMVTKRRRSSNEDGAGTGSDSSAMKIVVKRTVQNEWKININNENATEQITSPLALIESKPETVEEPKIKPQPIVLRMRRKSKKNTSLRMRNGNGSITKNPSLIQANAIKAKYENRRKHKFMSADRTVKPKIPVPEIPPWKKNTSTNVIIIPHKFEITVPYGCNLCGHLAYSICDYVLHIKQNHNKEKLKPHAQAGQVTPLRNQSNVNATASNFVVKQPLVQMQPENEPFVKSPTMIACQQPIIQGHQVPMIPPNIDADKSNLNKSNDDINTSTDKSSSSDNKCNDTSSFESTSSFTPPKNKETKKISPSKVPSKLDAIVSNLMVARKESIESNGTSKENVKQNFPDSNDLSKERIKSEIKTTKQSTGTKWPATDSESTTETEETTDVGKQNITVSNDSESNEFETSNSSVETAPKVSEQSTEMPKNVNIDEIFNTHDPKIIPHKPGVSMSDYEHVKILKLSKEVISIFEEAFDTFPYLSEDDYVSLSVITGVDIKDMEKIFETARIRNAISWEKHHIIAAASSLGKNKS